jgi:hypothetical protein
MARADEAPAVMAGAIRPGTGRGRDGFFRVAQDVGGRWWMFDPEGAPFFVRGVHGVSAAEGQGDGALPLDAAGRLRRWGFNALGVGPDGAVREDGLPFLAAVDFCRIGQPIVAGGVRLPDVFDPEWPRLAHARAAEVCPALADTRALLGWVADTRLEWGAPVAGRPSLLQRCLSLEPGFPAYHAAWEFVLALHGGKLDSLSAAWGVAVPNKEVVRELTRADQGIGTRGYLRDETRWVREWARRYFSVAGAAIRAADPNHLVLGGRFGGRAGGAVLAECGYPAVDVALAPWHELPAATANPASPVIASDVSWTEDAATPVTDGGRPRRLTTFERMLRRARTSLDRMARHPAVVGYLWAQWQDEPGEQPPFARGLVHVNGAEAREHTEVLAQFNLRAEALHRSADEAARR